MQYFLLNGTFCETRPQGGDFKAALDAHHAYWEPYVKKGDILIGGPKTKGSGLFIMRGEDEETVTKLANEDPFVKAGVQTYEISEFKFFMGDECVKDWFAE